MSDDFFGLNLDFEDFDRLLRKDDLIEEPVSIDVFVRDKKFLGLEYDLSPIQTEIVRHATQIYKPETLCQLMGKKQGLEYYSKYTINEIVAMIGKGGGKDHSSRVGFAYIVYLLHCLRDPLEYFGKAYGVTIDLINLAVNAQQAKNVFFDPLKKLLLNSPYFNEVAMFEPRVSELIFFNRPIRCFSGHSESEGWEGYEILVAVLDEIAAFKTEAELKGEIRSKGSASAIYNMSKLSVMSRFPKVGKVILLSFPRHKDDFIVERYKAATEHDELKTWAIKAATWESNPTITREDLEPEFRRNNVEAESRFACNPPAMEDPFFREPDLVRAAFMYGDNPESEDGSWKPWFNGTDGFPRFIHLDLALKKDYAGLSMVHLSGMKNVQTMAGVEKLPILNVDYIKKWQAPVNGEINYADIRQTIARLGKKFTVASVTFDQFGSIEMIQSLRQWGYNADMHTVRKADYDTLQTAIYDGRLRGYWNEQLVEQELLKLKLINNTKVDHPRQGSKDLADSLAGAVYMCVQHFDIDVEMDIEIYGDFDLDDDTDEVIELLTPAVEPEEKIPADLKDWLLEVI